ncbi:type II toxin-antitoxin system VapC family toxin [Natranaeroarchaeum aerophilus]|uniref:Type II toxin-antitoxin system VapC family toxin n=1 Tax=Natranaeroarchaeum aerophilus TaxID=2917711 RepID=A0AAE3FLG3_9EURY|nr:type II toxin-antitoxin system VapC family toxin [Natranaeroarchaeum aerophilus]MCL9812072.1 type II toxin-antitoxin system VapC family toxin [Natranaeroarchaeum aerophilus]
MKVLDSSFCAEFLRGYDHAKRYRMDHQDEAFVLPAIGLYELYHGALKTDRNPIEIEQDLPWVERIEYTPEHALEGARIRNELEKNGQRIQHPDMMIAGVARFFDAPVVTTDGGFEAVEGLVVENPRELY